MSDEIEKRMAALRGDHSEERCSLCGAQAAHKIAEELHAPASMHEAVHELTATLCAGCFDRIFRGYKGRETRWLLQCSADMTETQLTLDAAGVCARDTEGQPFVYAFRFEAEGFEAAREAVATLRFGEHGPARGAAISELRLAFLAWMTGVLAKDRVEPPPPRLVLAIAAFPCPQCHQTGWTHKMDCSQGDLERVASHPKSGGIMVHILKSDSLWDGSRRPRCPGCNEVDGGHLEGCTERGHE